MMRVFRLLLAAAIAIFAAHALAFTFGSFTLTGPTDIVIPEDGAEHDFFYTLTNHTGESLDNLSPVVGPVSVSSGDPSEFDVASAAWGFGGSATFRTAYCPLHRGRA